MSSSVNPRYDSLQTLLDIAAKVNEQAHGKEPNQVLIRSFSESECLVDKQKSNIISRFFDVLLSFIRRKSITPYNLKQNLEFLNEKLRNSDLESINQPDKRQIITNLISTVHKFVDSHFAHLSSDVKVLMHSIDAQKKRLEKPAVEITVENKPSAAALEFTRICDEATKAFVLNDTLLDAKISEVGAFITSSDVSKTKEMKDVVGLFSVALQLHRKIERTVGQATYESYSETQALQKKYASLLSSIEKQQMRIAALYDKNPNYADRLFRAYNQFVNRIADGLQTCTKHEEPLRLQAYQNNDFRHFDAIAENISNASTFTQLNLLLTLLRRENVLIKSALSEEGIKSVQPKIEQCVNKLVEKTIALSKATREKMLEGAKNASSNWDVLKEMAIVNGYEETIVLLKEWSPKLRDQQKIDFDLELRQADLAVSQSKTMLRPKFQKTTEQLAKDVTTHLHKGSTLQHTGTVTAAPGSLAAGVLVAHDITINNCTNDERKFFQKMSDQVRAAKAAGLINFNDIIDLTGITVPAQTQTMFKVADLISVAYFVPTVLQMVYSGSSFTSALAFVGLGAVGIPYLVRRFAPKDLQQPLTSVLLVNYYGLGPAAWRYGERQMTDLTRTISTAGVSTPNTTQRNITYSSPQSKPVEKETPFLVNTTNSTEVLDLTKEEVKTPIGPLSGDIEGMTIVQLPTTPVNASIASMPIRTLPDIREQKNSFEDAIITNAPTSDVLDLTKEEMQTPTGALSGDVEGMTILELPTTPIRPPDNVTLTQGFTLIPKEEGLDLQDNIKIPLEEIEPAEMPQHPKPQIAQPMSAANATLLEKYPVSQPRPTPEPSYLSSALKSLAQSVSDFWNAQPELIGPIRQIPDELIEYPPVQQELNPALAQLPKSPLSDRIFTNVTETSIKPALSAEEELLLRELLEEEPSFFTVMESFFDSMEHVAGRIKEFMTTPEAIQLTPQVQLPKIQGEFGTEKTAETFSNATFTQSLYRKPPPFIAVKDDGFTNTTFKPQDIEPSLDVTPVFKEEPIALPKQEEGFTNATFKPEDVKVAPRPDVAISVPNKNPPLPTSNASITSRLQNIESQPPVAISPSLKVEEESGYKRIFSWAFGIKPTDKTPPNKIVQERAQIKTNSFWQDFVKGMGAAYNADIQGTSEYAKGWAAAEKLAPTPAKFPQASGGSASSNEPHTPTNNIQIQNPPVRSV